MNTELIRKYERQCWNYQANCLDAVKFAELIVRECIDVLQKDLPGEDQVVTRNEVILRACNVAEHFGVEE